CPDINRLARGSREPDKREEAGHAMIASDLFAPLFLALFGRSLFGRSLFVDPVCPSPLCRSLFVDPACCDATKIGDKDWRQRLATKTGDKDYPKKDGEVR